MWEALLSHGLLRHGLLRHALLRHALLRHALLRENGLRRCDKPARGGQMGEQHWLGMHLHCARDCARVLCICRIYSYN